MKKRTGIVGALIISLGMIVLAGCGKSQMKATIDVKYTSGNGAKAGAIDKSSNLELSNPSFDGTTTVFTYKNLHDDKVGGWVFGIVVRTFNQAGIEVDRVEKTLYPGDVSSLPCTGKIVSVLTSQKQQNISRVEIEHVGSFSQKRFDDTLKSKLGR